MAPLVTWGRPQMVRRGFSPRAHRGGHRLRDVNCCMVSPRGEPCRIVSAVLPLKATETCSATLLPRHRKRRKQGRLLERLAYVLLTPLLVTFLASPSSATHLSLHQSRTDRGSSMRATGKLCRPRQIINDTGDDHGRSRPSCKHAKCGLRR